MVAANPNKGLALVNPRGSSVTVAFLKGRKLLRSAASSFHRHANINQEPCLRKRIESADADDPYEDLVMTMARTTRHLKDCQYTSRVNGEPDEYGATPTIKKDGKGRGRIITG